MNRYYSLDPDYGCVNISISDLNEEQKQHIIDLDIGIQYVFYEENEEETKNGIVYEENGIIFTYSLVIDATMLNNKCYGTSNDLDKLIKYLRTEGFKNKGSRWSDY